MRDPATLWVQSDDRPQRPHRRDRALEAVVAAFHRSLPDYEPTPLIDLGALAERIGIGRLQVKYEGARVGLPAFKILGAAWATRCALDKRLAANPSRTLEELRASLGGSHIRQLVAATDGNHGRAVARIARWLGLEAQIFVPAGTVEARVAAIQSEAAQVVTVNGTYDDAVLCCAAKQTAASVLVSDTPCLLGGADTAVWVMEGYATIPREVSLQIREGNQSLPEIVLVQVGTGGLAASFIRHFGEPDYGAPPTVVAVEPNRAACALAAARAGEIVTIPVGPGASIMAGLNCGTVSSVAWPWLQAGVDLFLTVGDERAREAMRALGDYGVVAGETGAASVAGLLELLASPSLCARLPVRLDHDSSVLVVCTEGATDPAAYAKVIGTSTSPRQSHAA